MPRKPIDYSKTQFYKIVCKDLNISDCYVGHTTDFTKRKSYHRLACLNESNKYYHLPLYKFIRENGSWENWEMILISEKPCENSLQARSIEREYYEELKSSLNDRIPVRTTEEKKQLSKEYHLKYSEYFKQRQKEWSKANKLKLQKQLKDWNTNNEEHVKDYRKNYYCRIKAKSNEQSKKYYQENRDRILEKRQKQRIEQLEDK